MDTFIFQQDISVLFLALIANQCSFEWYITIYVLLCAILSSKGSNLQLFKKFQEICSQLLFPQEIHLLKLQSIRDLVLGDLWQLSERFYLMDKEKVVTCKQANKGFLLREMAGMLWKPLLPIFIFGVVLDAIVYHSNAVDYFLIRFIDKPDKYPQYYAFASLSAKYLLWIVSFNQRTLALLQSEEITNMSFRTRLNIFKYHLQTKFTNVKFDGKDVEFQIERLVDNLNAVRSCMIVNVLPIISSMATLYPKVGFIAFIYLVPLGFKNGLRRVIHRLVGSNSNFSIFFSPFRHSSDINSLHRNIKLIKFCGWEKYFLNIPLQAESGKEKRPWYWPLPYVAWFVYDMLFAVANNISVYVIIYIVVKMNSGQNSFSNADMFELLFTLDFMSRRMSGLLSSVDSIKAIQKSSINLENMILESDTKTLPNVSVGKNGRPTIDLGKCSFSWENNSHCINPITLHAKDDELITVVGSTGSGKSSLLLAMCGEMAMTDGQGEITGKISYLEQSSWIMNDTMRANILFGKEFDKQHYWKVVRACALLDDIEMWPNRDLTLIGERGINISGGQKSRLALARAIYVKADIYILDDPLSAVDALVKKHILDNVLLKSGLLGTKLRIVATNDRAVLPFSDQVIIMDNGKASVSTRQPKWHFVVSNVHENVEVEEGDDDDEELSATTEISTDETAKAYTNWQNFVYIIKLCGSVQIIVLMICGFGWPLFDYIIRGKQLEALKENSGMTQDGNTDALLYYLKLKILKSLVDFLLRAFKMTVIDRHVAQNLTTKLKRLFISSVIHSPMSFFEDHSSYFLNSVFNQSSKNVSSSLFSFFMGDILSIVQTCLELVYVLREMPVLAILLPLVVIGVNYTNKLLLPAIYSLNGIIGRHKIKKEHAEGNIVEGSRLIRIYEEQDYFMSKFIDATNEVTQIKHPLKRISCIDNILKTGLYDLGKQLSTTFYVVQALLTGAVNLSGSMIVMTEIISKLLFEAVDVINIGYRFDSLSDGINKYRMYLEIKPEAPYIINNCRPAENWPNKGHIEFKEFSISYRPELKPAIKSMDLAISPGEKIGIVGRTGAGKSTLVKSLFRLIGEDSKSGQILIDGQDISQFGVGDLRPRLGIIPQECTMLDGSVRKNLDPLEQFTTAELSNVLVRCKLAKGSNDALVWNNGGKEVDLDKQLNENSFSKGEQQVFNMCRLLLRKPNIVILDEATSKVDEETDMHMQHLIREELKDCTVLTIAHRLETIMKSDRILVIDKGELKEFGSPKNLLDNPDGMFSQLVKANDFGND